MALFRSPLVVFALGLLVAAASLPGYGASVRAAGKPLLMVMAVSSSIRDISTPTLRRVFQGLPTEFEGSKRFIPVNHPIGTPARIQFDRTVLSLEPSQVGAFWIDRRIRDETPPPRTVPSAELAMRIAASLPGAITYISPEMVNASVRVLSVDGKSAGQHGYPLD
jgi:hypothetical protein